MTLSTGTGSSDILEGNDADHFPRSVSERSPHDPDPAAHSEMLCEALTAHGVPADLYLVEGAAHGADVFYQEEITEIVLSFLDRYSRT